MRVILLSFILVVINKNVLNNVIFLYMFVLFVVVDDDDEDDDDMDVVGCLLDLLKFILLQYGALYYHVGFNLTVYLVYQRLRIFLFLYKIALYF